MAKHLEDEPDDKAGKRLRQFEMAREPRVSNEDLLEGLDELIAELLTRGDTLSARAAKRLQQFRNNYFLREGFEQRAPGGEGGPP